jgi:hypothetical protein
MGRSKGPSAHERWAHLRFSVIGQLLAAPPPRGQLRFELERLAARTWQHPITGERVHFALSTIERWLSAERIVLRSGTAGRHIFPHECRPLLRITLALYRSAISSAMS